MPSNHLILCCPLFLLPLIFPSSRVFSNKSVFHIRWSKYWKFSFSISPSKEYSGWFSLGLTSLISLLSKEPSKVFSSTAVQKHQFFSAQLFLWSNSHISTWLLEKLALTTWTFVSKVISLLFNILSRFIKNKVARPKQKLSCGCVGWWK